MEAVAGSALPLVENCQLVSLTVQCAGDQTIRNMSFQQDTVLIGRRSLNDVILDDLTVSGRHAEILRKDNGFTLCDLGSRNGTLIDSRPVSSANLESGVIFKVGIYTLTFALEESPAPVFSAEAKTCTLEYLSGGMRGIRQRLDQSITRVSANGQVVVVSRRKTGFFVTHLEGNSRPVLNGRPVGNSAVLLRHDDVLELNATRIRFRLH